MVDSNAVAALGSLPSSREILAVALDEFVHTDIVEGDRMSWMLFGESVKRAGESCHVTHHSHGAGICGRRRCGPRGECEFDMIFPMMGIA
jgi:hypothetical protein